MGSITIKELTAQVSTSADVSKAVAEQTILDLFNLMTSTLHGGEEVVVRNFGRFYTHNRLARKGRHPTTGAVIDIPAKAVIKFTPRGDLKVAP
jgi:DNA-binding protein HU-beta